MIADKRAPETRAPLQRRRSSNSFVSSNLNPVRDRRGFNAKGGLAVKSKRCSNASLVSDARSLSLEAQSNPFGVPFEQLTPTQQELLNTYVAPNLLQRKLMRDAVVANLTEVVRRQIALKRSEMQRNEEHARKQQVSRKQRQTTVSLYSGIARSGSPGNAKASQPRDKRLRARDTRSERATRAPAAAKFGIRPVKASSGGTAAVQARVSAMLSRYSVTIAPITRPAARRSPVEVTQPLKSGIKPGVTTKVAELQNSAVKPRFRSQRQPQRSLATIPQRRTLTTYNRLATVREPAPAALPQP